MKTVSGSFNTAFDADSMHIKAKVVIEFGNNRFNDSQVVTASSTKLVNRGVNTDVEKSPVDFWNSSEVFNNKNRNTMRWLVCDSGAKADGTYRALNIDDDSGTYEHGWWSANRSDGAGNFSSPEWVQSTFNTRRINKVILYTTEGYPNMKNISIQYRDSSFNWIEVVTATTLGSNNYINEWTFTSVLATGLRIYINSTYDSLDFARINELQGVFEADISSDIISCDVEQVREEYDGTVPLGITGANTCSIELQNIDQKYSPHNGGSLYYPYIDSNNKVYISYGIDTDGLGTFEYTPMGQFWVEDGWSISGDSMVARIQGRDFSRFMQDEKVPFGKLYENYTVTTILKDIAARVGLSSDELDIDTAATRVLPLFYIKDNTIWQALSELAFADQGIFGFDEYGKFYYHSYTRLNSSPYTSSVYTYSNNTNLISGEEATKLYANKVLVKTNPPNKEFGLRSIWEAPNPTVLSWTSLGLGISSSDTVINAAHYLNNTSQAEHLFPEKNGYFCIGLELIKYATRLSTSFTGCERGYGGTVAASHSGGDYIGEARYWEVEYSDKPAYDVRFPLITAIDSLLKEDGEGTPQAKILIYKRDAFSAVLAVANTVEYLTILEGTGRSQKTDDSELPWYTTIPGYVIAEKSGAEELGKAEASNKDFIRRYGKQELTIDNQWINTQEHAQQIADAIIAEYGTPRRIIEFETITNPALQLADRVNVFDYPQLSIANQYFHVIGLNYRYDGGLQCRATLREVKP